MLAMAVMAVTIPLVLALVVAGGESSREAERETRSVMTARSVFEEVRRARVGNSDLVEEGELPWGEGEAGPSFSGEESEWLTFELDREGRLLGVADGVDYEEGLSGDSPEVTAFAAIRGRMAVLEGTTDAEGEPLELFQLELRIESPARGVARARERNLFIKTDARQ
jgi:hypothetical protein